MATQRYSVTPHPIETLLTWVKSGEIAIPEIQRPFVWDATKVRNLLDSLYQGYPVGYLIAWRNPSVRLKDGSTSSGKRILIDGQQRVTALSGERDVHLRRGPASLAGMRLVDDDGKGSPAMPVPDLIQDELELLHRGDDDLLSLLQKGPQLLRPFCDRADDGGHLCELLDGVADLLVEHATVGDHDDGVESGLTATLQSDQLVAEPGN
jgi:hypothetical protein